MIPIEFLIAVVGLVWYRHWSVLAILGFYEMVLAVASYLWKRNQP